MPQTQTHTNGYFSPQHLCVTNDTFGMRTFGLAILMFLAAATAVRAQTPWVLGDETQPACWDLSNNVIAIPPGVDLQWVQPLPEPLSSASAHNAEYTVTVDHATFWSDATNAAMLGADFAKWRGLCDPSQGRNVSACTTSNTTDCCVFHSNLHSCRQSTGSQCEPWVRPQNVSANATCGSAAANTVLVTHTGSSVGGIEAYAHTLQLPEGSWIVIAHIKIMNFQCAVGAVRRSVAPVAEASNATTLGLAIGLSVGVVLIAIAAVVAKVVTAEKNVRDVSNAPLGGDPVTLIFTDIQDSTQLWANYTVSMAQALDVHHAVIREAIVNHKAYEVKTVGDAFMIAVKTPEAALKIARDIQLGLYAKPFPRCISEHYEGIELEDRPDDTTQAAAGAVFHGLRVRVGIHTGHPEVAFDEVSKGYDYYGPDVNLAARTEAAGVGGQIVVTASVADVITADMKLEAGPTGHVQMKGIDDPVLLTSVTVLELPVKRLLAVAQKGVQEAWAGDDDQGNLAASSQESMFNAGNATEESVARRLYEQGQRAHPLAAYTLLVAERRHTLETMLKPLRPDAAKTVLKALAEGWRTRNHVDDRTETILGLIARIIPSEGKGSDALNSSQSMNASMGLVRSINGMPDNINSGSFAGGNRSTAYEPRSPKAAMPGETSE